jgi:hypothetical protein
VKEARRRRDLFKDAFADESDVAEAVIASGSLARSTQRDPINDVDVIIVFDGDVHPEWGQPGESAQEALEYTGKRINALLGATNGSFAREVRLARPGNHAVKCFLDDLEAQDPFTVDAMPALRRADGTLLVPEKSSRDWIATDPEHLIRAVADKHERWALCRPMIRVIKLWKDVHDTDLKSLTAEVLALNHLPETESTRPRALQRFFTAAERAIDGPIEDPAGLCGAIQPDLDRDKARAAIADAARASWLAVAAQDQGDTDRAACLWRVVFGDAFPEPEEGCPATSADEVASGGLGFAVGTGIGVTHRRPVRDAPQGTP